MRSQGTKPVPKKGALTKTTFKPNLSTRPVKKKVVTKKVKKLVKKSLFKTPKRCTIKDDSSDTKTEDDSSAGDKSDLNSAKAGTSEPPPPLRSDSPTKRTKKLLKEKKQSPNPPSESVKLASKKSVNQKVKLPSKKIKKKEDDSDKIRYKLNSEIRTKATSKMVKLKMVTKKEGATNQKKKPKVLNKNDSSDTINKEDKNTDCDSKNNQEANDSISVDKKDPLPEPSKIESVKVDSEINTKSDNSGNQNWNPSTPTNSKTSSAETSKSESDRPPKFFTSARSPRTVDIDVRCCKTSKGNLNVSSKIVDPINDEVSKDKSASNNLVSQDPEIDVYAFTDKADSPKNILSDFRNPMNKNIGKVRPIARVKGTVIDKKFEIEKKKFSPHRPIEEVVKQLKAKKGSEVVKVCQTQTSPDVTSSVDSSIGSDEKDNIEDPKPIVSKSYKMVARKSSIPGKPFSPIKFLDQHDRPGSQSKSPLTGKKSPKSKSKSPKSTMSDDELENSKFSLNTKSQTCHYSSSDESLNDSNDDNDTKESSESESNTNKKTKKTKKYRRITDCGKKYNTSRELKELSKDSIIDLKDDSILGNEKPSKRRLKLLSMWSGPKKHRMASLNAIAKVHCLYENESRTHMELGLMKTVDRLVVPTTSKPSTSKKKEPQPKDSSDEKQDTTSESEYERKEKKDVSSEDDIPEPSTRTLRGVPGIRSAGKYWDPKSCTSSSEDSEHDSKIKVKEKKKITPKPSTSKPESDKPPAKMKKTAGVPVKKRRIRNEVTMDLKDMVVQKRMASLNATAILAASYEKRSSKSSKDGTTSDSCSDESFSRRPKNGVGSGVKPEAKTDAERAEPKECEELVGDRKQKVEVIVNQDTDVTITGVYSTHHEGFCTVSGLQYRISATSHTQTTATANCDKEGCSRDEGARYTPLSALSSMQPPPAEKAHTHPVPELGGLARRAAGCSSAFSAPSPSAHHEPGYYQPAGPLIKESGSEADRALARYHPPHYHPPHPSVLPQYGPYYPPELCYGRYYQPPAPAYHMPAPQPDAPMVGVGNEPYPPPQYYAAPPPCYQHPPPRVGYLEYRGCPCPMNACPKNVHIGPATGKAPASGGPADAPAPAPPGAPFRPKGRARADSPAVAHGSGKDPPLEPEPPAAADAPRPCPLPAIGGASPKRELYAGRARRGVGGAAEGPPSPARGSAGACTPQPPPAPPRRARLGKAMARRSLAGDDTTVLSPPPAASDADDDVLAMSPPAAAPIDLSSSDETERHSAPLRDVKKENEPPTCSPQRNPEAQALREHNAAPPRPASALPASPLPASPRPAKRRHSRPKLEIELGELPLDDACRTNGIGEHVKLQKRRKVSSEQNEAANRTETITSKDIKKKSSPKPKRSPKSTPTENKNLKRKGESENTVAKRINVGKPEVEDVRLTNVAALPQEQSATKPKNKSALLLDNLIRKNSIDRVDAIDVEINPAELFLSPRGNSPLNCTKKTLNINNNVVENSTPVNGVQPKTIAAVTQLIERKLAASKNALKTTVVEANVTQSLKPTKSVLKPQNAEVGTEDNGKTNNDVSQCEPVFEKDNSEKTNDISKDTSESANVTSAAVVDNVMTIPIKIAEKPKLPERNAIQNKNLTPVSKGPAAKPTESVRSEPSASKPPVPAKPTDTNKPDKVTAKRSKLSIEKEPKSKGDKGAHEKVVKLMVFKKSVIKADEAAAVVEEACASPLTVRPSVVRRARRRRSGLKRHRRRPPALLPPPLTDREPRWSNGWHWDGECHVSKVYLNNDMRMDRTARCYSRMLHENGDLISRGDCVLLRAAPAKAQPFVAKVARLWENPDDGEMMVSLVWYYRPEHTELGRTEDDAPDEVFASRHRDANSVACIEDKCYVLTFNEYCRYKKRLKAAEEGITIAPSIVPPMPSSEVFPAVDTNDSKLTAAVPPDLVLFCRKIYDFRTKKIQMPNK